VSLFDPVSGTKRLKIGDTVLVKHGNPDAGKTAEVVGFPSYGFYAIWFGGPGEVSVYDREKIVWLNSMKRNARWGQDYSDAYYESERISSCSIGSYQGSTTMYCDHLVVCHDVMPELIKDLRGGTDEGTWRVVDDLHNASMVFRKDN